MTLESYKILLAQMAAAIYAGISERKSPVETDIATSIMIAKILLTKCGIEPEERTI